MQSMAKVWKCAIKQAQSARYTIVNAAKSNAGLRCSITDDLINYGEQKCSQAKYATHFWHPLVIIIVPIITISAINKLHKQK